ncbi:MAG: choice-of-anchor U domain-containing protein [Limisphaerales bacterium]
MGYNFPLGLISYTVKGIAPGSSVTITNILHDTINFSTVWAYGPTVSNSIPHWYMLASSTSGDEVRLTLTDGGNGDNDLTANGSITVFYGLAYQIPALPQLKASGASQGDTRHRHQRLHRDAHRLQLAGQWWNQLLG